MRECRVRSFCMTVAAVVVGDLQDSAAATDGGGFGCTEGSRRLLLDSVASVGSRPPCCSMPYCRHSTVENKTAPSGRRGSSLARGGLCMYCTVHSTVTVTGQRSNQKSICKLHCAGKNHNFV